MPDSLAECGDAACRSAWAEARWGQDPEAVAVAVAGMSDPVAQEGLVIALTRAHPGETAALCAQLSAGAVRRRCEVLNTRPHLRAVVPKELPDAAADRRPGLFLERLDQARLASPYGGVGMVVAEDCQGQVDPTGCVTHQAALAAAAGDPTAAAGLCGSTPDTRWRQECFFESAERALDGGGSPADAVARAPEHLPVALDLCLAAEAYAARCARHLVGVLARAAPPAARGTAEQWRALAGAIEAGRAHLAARDPGVATAFVDRAWAEAAWTSVSPLGGVGVAAAQAPAEALPHLRAAAALLVVAGDGGERGLDALSRAVGLAERTPAQTGIDSAPGVSVQIDDRWAQLLPGEAELPWLHYVGDYRRVYAEDPATDRRICVLEAAAQGAAPRLAVLDEGLLDADPAVRFTAARLLSATDPGRAVARPLDDPDALVAARLAAGP